MEWAPDEKEPELGGPLSTRPRPWGFSPSAMESHRKLKAGNGVSCFLSEDTERKRRSWKQREARKEAHTVGHIPTSSHTFTHSHSSELLSYTLRASRGNGHAKQRGCWSVCTLGHGWGNHGAFYLFISQKYSEAWCPYFMGQNTEAKGG